MRNKMRRVALGLMALSMRLDAYAMQRGLTMDAAHPKDPDPKNWRTINGSKVHLTEGKIDGGAGGKFTGKEWTGKTKHEFTPKEKPKQEEVKTKANPNAKKTAANPESTPKPQAITKPQAKKVEKGTFNDLPSSKQKNVITILSAWGSAGMDFGVDKNIKHIQQHYGLGNAEAAEIKNTFEKLKNKTISEKEFKDTVASIILNGAAGEVTQQTKASPEPKDAAKLQSRKVETGAFEKLTSYKQKNNISSLADYGYLGFDFDIDEIYEFESIQECYELGNKEMKEIKNAYDELRNKTISKKKFKDTVASIIHYSVVEENSKPGELQTKGLSKTKLTKATTGISAPKGTLGLYATDDNKKVIDPAFKNFEKQYGLKQTAKYNESETVSVYFYTHDSKSLRDYLCYGKRGKGVLTKEKLQEHADNISAGLAKMEHPNMWVFRKCSLKDWSTKDNPDGVTFEALQKMQKEGTVFTNASFLSSTPVDGGTYGDSQLFRHFFVPKEAQGGYIKSSSKYENEKEFLLDKGSKTRIMKVEKKDGKIITYEEVVLDD